MCSMTNGNRLPPAYQPSGIIPAQRPACPPETAAPRRRPAGARPDGSAEQPAPVQAERQASGRAGTTEQERSRQAAARAATAPPSHTTSRQPRPADQPRPAGDRAADPTQPSPSARSDPVRESRGGEEEREKEERRGHRCKFPAQVIICRTRRQPPRADRPGAIQPQRHQRATGTARRAARQFCFWRECRTSDPATPEERRETAPPGSSSPTRPGEPRHFRDTRSSTISVQYLHLHTISPKTNSTPNRHRMLYPYNSSSEPHSS